MQGSRVLPRASREPERIAFDALRPEKDSPGTTLRARARTRRRAALLAASLAALGACGSEPARPGDVILITIDTLRADHVGLYGYPAATTPNLDRWFGDGAIFERAYSTEASTSPSVVSVLSGLYPQEHGVRLFFQLLDEEVPLVTDLLPAAYQTAAFVSNMVLTDEAIGLAGRFDHYDDFVADPEPARKIFERDAARTTDAVLRWLAAGRDPERPLFLWVHYIDPHGPYRPPEERRFTAGSPPLPIPIERVPKYMRDIEVTDGNEYVRRYDGEIAHADAEIGRLLDALARAGATDGLLVLTADHGESMMEHEQWFTHGYQVYDEIVRVPLLLSGPGLETGRCAVPVSGTDVASTILRFAGVEPPDALRGDDLRRAAALDRERIVFAEATDDARQWRAAVQGTRKWVVAVEGPGRAIVERRLYELATDPDERSPGAGPDGASPLAELLQRTGADPDPAGIPGDYREGMRRTSPKVAPDASEEELERLRALGYAE